MFVIFFILIIVLTFYFVNHYTNSGGIIRKNSNITKNTNKLENETKFQKNLTKYELVLPHILTSLFGQFHLFFPILAILLSFCLINTDFPFAGMFVATAFLTISIFAQIFWFEHSTKKIWDILSTSNSQNPENKSESKLEVFSTLINSAVWSTALMFFGLIYLVRDSNSLLSFFNFLAIIYSFSFLVQTHKISWKWNFENLISAPFLLIADVLNTPNLFRIAKEKEQRLVILANKETNPTKINNILGKFQLFWNKESQRKVFLKKFSEIILGTIFGFFILLIIVPILASTNPIFANFLTNLGNFLFDFLQFFNLIPFLEFLFPFLNSFIFGLNFWRLIFAIIFWLILPRLFGSILTSSVTKMNLITNSSANLSSENKIDDNSKNNSPNFLTGDDLQNDLELKTKIQNKSKSEINSEEVFQNLAQPNTESFVNIPDSDQKSQNKIDSKLINEPNSTKILDSNSIKEESTKENSQTLSKNLQKSNQVLLIPKLSLILVLVVYLISQISLYFATPSELSALGYTFGKLNNEVFGQLSVVCLIVFGLVFIDQIRQILHKISSWVLLLQSSFLALVATKSVWDYISVFGLTFKRLYGVVVVIFIFGIITILSCQTIQKLSKIWVLQRLVYFIFILLILVNLVNFDALIYHNLPSEKTSNNIEKTSNNNFDYNYYTELSLDNGNFDKILNRFIELRKLEIAQSPTKYEGQIPSENYRIQIFNSLEECQKETKICYKQKNYNQNFYTTKTALQKAGYLQQKYRSFGLEDWAIFNVTEWQTFQKIKNLEIAKLQSELID